jgi:hypothetical protein
MMRFLVAATLLLAGTVARADLAAADKAGVRALVDRWVDAQNQGDLPAYQALYGPVMTGIRRSGAKTVYLDRAQWMTDRARMFKKKMTVTVTALRALPQGERTQVLFTQTFESGSYKDVGPKELILDGKPPLIVREEMLSSKLEGPAAARAQAKNLFYAPIIDGKLVLLVGAERSWGIAPRRAGDTRPVKVISDVKADRLPAALRFEGRQVKLYDASGARCDATIGALHVLSRVDLPLGADEYRSKKPKQIVEDALSWGEPHLLVGDLAGDACPGAIFGRAAELPAVKIFTPVMAPAPAAAAAKLAAERVFDVGGSAHAVLAFTVDEKDRSKTLLVVQKGYGGRSDAWLCYEQVGERLIERMHPKPANGAPPLGAADVDGDGILELLLPGNLLRSIDGWFDESLVPPVADHDLDLEQGC